MATAPSWPSLYDPGVEVIHIPHRNPIQQEGFYLHHSIDIFRFTLYWTLIFYTPIFVLCGSYAFWNLNFPPSPLLSSKHDPLSPEAHELVRLPTHRGHARHLRPSKLPKEHERRSRIAFALLVFLTFMILGVAGAVVASAVLGFTVFGLYKAANFNMSTWIPFLLAAIQVLVSLMCIWPSIIDII
ncbi:hypothetical protein L208DRAFT_1408055 [Tricholoma matsutake]|nr:hypothetical protein L208DRAFT_1408055 [Tricholoma matsutake 945]